MLAGVEELIALKKKVSKQNLFDYIKIEPNGISMALVNSIINDISKGSLDKSRIKDNIGKEKINEIIAISGLTEKEKAIIRFNKVEQATGAIQLFHVTSTSLYGLLCGAFFLSASGLTFSIVFGIAGLLTLILFGLGKRANDKIFLEQNKDIELKIALKKIEFELYHIKKIKLEKLMNAFLEIFEKYLKDIIDIDESENKNEYINFSQQFNYIEDYYLSSKGILALTRYLKKNSDGQFGDLINQIHQINNEYLINLKEHLDAIIRTASPELEHHKDNKKTFIKPIPDSIKQENINKQMTVWVWLKEQQASIIKSSLGTLLGTTAGTMVFPGVAVALSSSIQFHIAAAVAFAAFVFTPQGALITVSVAILVGLAVLSLVLYSSYRNEIRKNEIAKLENSINNEKQKVEFLTNKVLALSKLDTPLKSLSKKILKQHLEHKAFSTNSPSSSSEDSLEDVSEAKQIQQGIGQHHHASHNTSETQAEPKKEIFYTFNERSFSLQHQGEIPEHKLSETQAKQPCSDSETETGSKHNLPLMTFFSDTQPRKRRKIVIEENDSPSDSPNFLRH